MAVYPRWGFAFPITATVVIMPLHGQFFQIPECQRLYENPRFARSWMVPFNTVLGNADLASAAIGPLTNSVSSSSLNSRFSGPLI